MRQTKILRSKPLEIASKAGIALTALHLQTFVHCTDLFSKAETASNNFFTKLISLAETVFPLALIILLLMIVFTHDEKKLGLCVKLLFGAIFAFAIIEIIAGDSSIVVRTITSIIGS